jgi:hypothetical protein
MPPKISERRAQEPELLLLVVDLLVGVLLAGEHVGALAAQLLADAVAQLLGDVPGAAAATISS